MRETVGKNHQPYGKAWCTPSGIGCPHAAPLITISVVAPPAFTRGRTSASGKNEISAVFSLVQKARDAVIGRRPCRLNEFRLALFAFFHAVRTAVVKTAARTLRVGRRHVAFQYDALASAFDFRIGDRNGGK